MDIMSSTMDIYATKGIEYLLVIGFLVFLIIFWRLLAAGPSGAKARAGRAGGAGSPDDVVEWLRVPRGTGFHPGHTWARPENGDGSVLRVGLDAFAARLAGRPEGISAGKVGDALRAGEKGWTLTINGKRIGMLAPVDGEILAFNESALASPAAAVSEDPYGRGWILKVKTGRGALKNLLRDDLASVWMLREADALTARLGRPIGTTLPDGGLPVDAWAAIVEPENWDRLLGEFFLTEPDAVEDNGRRED